MTQVTTTRMVNLDQLGTETGWPLSMADDGTRRVVTCHDAAVTADEVEAAIDAHEPAPPPPTPEELRASMQTQIDELADLVLMQGLML